jgi:regulator of sigma E protease
MNMFTGFNLLLIIFGFGFLIFVHELGHFLAAKWAGIKVLQFAIGFGKPIASWRRGLGFRAGSSEQEFARRIANHLGGADPNGAGSNTVDLQTIPVGAMDRAARELGLGETEYRLNWLPLGGYVKMLGQEDLHPGAISDDPRSYGRCPVGKRMVVVSAGVIANIITAIAFFIIAFLVGVKFEAATVGGAIANLPAATTMPENASALGISEPGLRPGDRIVAIDGKRATTFSDVEIASAMSRPGRSLDLLVERPGMEQPLRFVMMPKVSPVTELLSLGIFPGASSTLSHDSKDVPVELALRRSGLSEQGVRPGMRLVTVNGLAVTTFGEMDQIASETAGAPLQTTWTELDKKDQPIGQPVSATMQVRPEYQALVTPAPAKTGADVQSDEGLLGLSPLTRIARVTEGSPNKQVLQGGDLIVRIGSRDYPRLSQVVAEVHMHKGMDIPLVVERQGTMIEITGEVTGKGQLGIELESAFDLPRTADPANSVVAADDPARATQTPIAALNLMPGTFIRAVDGVSVESWSGLRGAIRQATIDAKSRGEGATLKLSIAHPVADPQDSVVEVQLSSDEVAALHKLRWMTDMPAAMFEPVHTVRSAEGNPLRAVAMGFEETWKMMVLTYLTIDRLFRGSVGVKQLHGPVGIVHLGTKIADRGFMYMIFFLALISVNLAVINFLPLPIVDGGLFLFLIYEKLKGQPPSLAFQNAATIVGLVLIGSIFVITFYNDIMRLVN